MWIQQGFNIIGYPNELTHTIPPHPSLFRIPDSLSQRRVQISKAASNDKMSLVNTPCKQCQKLTVDRGLPGRSEEDWVLQIDVPYHRKDTTPDFPGLLTSLNNGCSLCGLLRDVFLFKFAESRSPKNGGKYLHSSYLCGNCSPCYSSQK